MGAGLTADDSLPQLTPKGIALSFFLSFGPLSHHDKSFASGRTFFFIAFFLSMTLHAAHLHALDGLHDVLLHQASECGLSGHVHVAATDDREAFQAVNLS